MTNVIAVQTSRSKEEVESVFKEALDWGADEVVVLAMRKGQQYHMFNTGYNLITLLGVIELIKVAVVEGPAS